ncbi:unnamed protein product [Paramecium octaurelia]|uniref:Uncharacterized protein n=1 Tax=Paramecium octaurelia TaxID=43137 RepID=A0A8S1WY47_PAROT|nr:unnamed protein product [Paramecium octaurelia]
MIDYQNHNQQNYKQHSLQDNLYNFHPNDMIDNHNNRTLQQIYYLHIGGIALQSYLPVTNQQPCPSPQCGYLQTQHLYDPFQKDIIKQNTFISSQKSNQQNLQCPSESNSITNVQAQFQNPQEKKYCTQARFQYNPFWQGQNLGWHKCYVPFASILTYISVTPLQIKAQAIIVQIFTNTFMWMHIKHLCMQFRTFTSKSSKGQIPRIIISPPNYLCDKSKYNQPHNHVYLFYHTSQQSNYLSSWEVQSKSQKQYQFFEYFILFLHNFSCQTSICDKIQEWEVDYLVITNRQLLPKAICIMQNVSELLGNVQCHLQINEYLFLFRDNIYQPFSFKAIIRMVKVEKGNCYINYHKFLWANNFPFRKAFEVKYLNCQ